MSMFRRPMDIKDRIQGKLQGSSAIRTGIRTVREASRRAGVVSSNRGKAKSGPINLQYKNLQEPVDRDFEAVLDGIGAASDSNFAGSVSRATGKHTSTQHVSEQRTGGGGKPSHDSKRTTGTAADDEDTLFPLTTSDAGEHVTTEPPLGQAAAPDVDTSRTDSEGGESEDLELDSETVDVLKSLNLVDSRANSVDSDTDVREDKVGEGGDVLGGRKTKLAVNNESANNNTHIQSGEEMTSSCSSGKSAHKFTQLARGEEPAQGEREPTLEDLLERGSAALGSRDSPHCSSPLSSPPRLADSSSPSPLTSSYEVDPFCEPPSNPFSSRLAATDVQTHVHTTGTSQKHTGLASSVNVNRRNFISREGTLKDCDEDLPSDATGTAQGDREPHRTSVENDLFPDDARLLREKHSTSPRVVDEDELFPDDARLLHSPEASRSSQSQNNALDIREDHFSSTPEEQRKPVKSLGASPPHRQKSTGRVAPPRPPRSPQLNSRLRMRQRERNRDEQSPPKSNTLSHFRSKPPASEAAVVKVVRPLESTSRGAPTEAETNKREHDSNTEAHQSEDITTTSSSRAPSTAPQTVTDTQGGEGTETVSTTTAITQNISTDTDIDSLELPFMPPTVHLSLGLLLYFYFTFNPFLYLAGLAAGFLAFYLCLGAVFVAYVQKEEVEAGEMSGSTDQAPGRGPSPEFMRSMSIRLEDYETRFVAPSQKHKFRFTAALHYDVATHHRRDRYPCRLKLVGDCQLHVCVFDSEGNTLLKRQIDLHREKACFTIVPKDVFLNRKRRWSKKYPIRVEVGGTEFFLFSNVSRFKQEWFFRLREASSGTKTRTLIKRQERFFAYMQRYFPSEPLHSSSTQHAGTSSISSVTSRVGTGSVGTTAAHHHHPAKSSRHSSQRKQRVDEGKVEFHSKSSGMDRQEEESGGDPAISISSVHLPSHRRKPQEQSITSSSSSSLSGPVSEHQLGRSPSIRSVSSSIASVEGGGTLANPQGQSSSSSAVPPSFESNWMNALTARLFWDVWHEERWKKWIMSRIQRKLVRIKTPGFLDPLLLTDIEVGDSMPVINRLHEGPYLRVDGVWVYLDVTYEGLFVMTIKTRLKLGRGRGEGEKGTEMKNVKHKPSHTQAAAVFQESGGFPAEDDSETGSEEEEEEEEEVGQPLANPLEEGEEGEERGKESPPLVASHSEAQPSLKRMARVAKLKKVVTRITRRVVSTRLVRRAAEKASSVPLELTVEVRKLKGVVAVNIPPPPSDAIWYGFLTTPKLELVAKPRLGKRAVTLSQITHWIERKLCSLVDEKLTLPNMEDVVIPILNSGLPEDTQKSL